MTYLVLDRNNNAVYRYRIRMNRKSLQQNICDECKEKSADVLVVEESIDMYSQSTRQIVCYACSNCSGKYVKEGFKEVPVFDVDPDVVEIEQLSSDSKEFTIKRRDSDDDEWMKMNGEYVVENVEGKR